MRKLSYCPSLVIVWTLILMIKPNNSNKYYLKDVFPSEGFGPFSVKVKVHKLFTLQIKKYTTLELELKSITKSFSFAFDLKRSNF